MVAKCILDMYTYIYVVLFNGISYNEKNSLIIHHAFPKTSLPSPKSGVEPSSYERARLVLGVALCLRLRTKWRCGL